MGRNRELSSKAAASAASAPPPAPRIEAAPNCAEPENTTADMTIGASAPHPSDRATTPKDTPTKKTASAKGVAARAPAR